MTAITCSALIHGYAVMMVNSYIAVARPCSSLKLSGSRNVAKKRCQPGDARHIRKAPLLYTNYFRILGLSLSDGDYDSHKTVPDVCEACTQPSPISAGHC